jgi:outer membrane receptor protein involved in Fe transport
VVSFFTSTAFGLGLGLLLCTSAFPDQAAEARSVSYELNIPAESLDQALQSLAIASHHKLLYRAELVAGKSSRALKGTFTTEQAMRELLSGTGLAFEITPASVVLIKEVSEGKTGSLSEEGTQPQTASPARLAQVNPQTSANAVDDTTKQDQEAKDAKKKKKSDSSSSDARSSDQGPTPTEGIPEILVKGSRILNVDIKRTVDDVQPYYIFDSQMLERSGATNLEEFFKQRLTMNTRELTNSQLAGSSQGNRSSIDLRGLGTNQTLILVNGHRLVGAGSGSSVVNQPDVNGIPMAAVERVEILPSSAAAIYGGGAVGGVVNIILKKNYTGGEVITRYGNTFDGVANQRALDANFGTSLEGGRTQLMLAGHYSDGGQLLEGERMLHQRGVTLINQNVPGSLYSAFSPFYLGSTSNISSPSNLTLKNSGTPLNSQFTFVPPGFSAGSDAAGFIANAGKQNFNPPASQAANAGLLSSIGAAPRVKSALATVQREMTENLELYTELSYVDNFAPTFQNLLDILPLSVPASAPTNPFQQSVTVRMPDATPVPADTVDDVERRWTIGAIYKLPSDWSATADYTWNSDHYISSIVVPNFARLIGAVAAGTVNPFVDTLAFSQNLGIYNGNETDDVTTTLNDLNVRVAGPVWRLPAGKLDLTAGLERRRDALQGLSGVVFQNFPTDDGVTLFPEHSQRIDSVYAELRVPVVSAANALPWARQIDLQLAGRREQYTVFTGTPSTSQGGAIVASESKFSSINPTFGFRYRPADALMLRASYGKGFLPPSLTQLAPNGPGIVVPITVFDPRRGNSPVTTKYILGGNPNLQPEKSKNLDVGIVFEPPALTGLRLSLDWYHIDKTDNITRLTPQATVDAEASLPTRVTRGPAPGGTDPFPTIGPITLIDATNLNLFKSQISGFDFSVEDRWQTESIGVFNIFGLATRIVHFKTQATLNAPLVENAGIGGGVTDVPLKYKANAGINWQLRDWTISWTSRFFDSYVVSTNPVVVAQQGAPKVASQIYHDAVVSYKPGSAASARGAFSGLRLQVGVKNVFNSVPPFDANAGIAPEYASPFGDFRLREYWLSVAKSF